jgi:hypothetical protein
MPYISEKSVASTFRAKNKPMKKGQKQAARENRLSISIAVTAAITTVPS